MKNLIILFVIFSLTACNQNTPYQPEGLRKLSESEFIERVKAGKTFPKTTVFKDSLGNVISDEDLKKIDINEFYVIYYVNVDEEIEEIVVKKDATYAQLLQKKITEAFEEDEPISLVDIDCSNITKILEEVYELDQQNRKGGLVENIDIDKKNQQIVVSIIENCCFPTIDEHGVKSVETVFLVIQHAGKGLRTQYFPSIKKSADKDELPWSLVALMEDRMLMDIGEKQKYGSQLQNDNGSSKWTVYPIEDPENVDKRRAKVGLEPIEDYLERFDLE